MKKKAGARASKGRKPGRKLTLLRADAASRRSAGSKSRGPDGTRSAVRRLRQELAKAHAEIERLMSVAETDYLLDILNRRGFERELTRSIAFMQRYSARGALLVLDVDRLKPINDMFGHAAGDQVLISVVSTLASQVRTSDVIGRLGGDEFAVLLWNLSETDARAKAAALEQAIDDLRFSFAGNVVQTGASMGVAVLDAHSDARTVIERADGAMYVRKAQRRHQTG